MSSAYNTVRLERKISTPRCIHLCSLALFSLSASLCGTAALAADASMANGKSRYQSERAVCLSGQSNQDRATCLREAGAARGEDSRGRLDEGTAQYQQNALKRCDALPQEDRQDCQRRIQGEGVTTTTGRPADGGVYRELVRPDPAPEASPIK